jgi:hypothetical protein
MAQSGKKYIPSKTDIQYVYESACQGISQSKMLEGLNIDWHTFQKNLPKFSDALKKGNEEYGKHVERQVPQVVNALLRRCLGYEFEEVTRKQDGKVIDGKLQDGDVTITKTIKHIQPSDPAIFFFLCNRSDDWVNPMSIEGKTLDNKGDILKWIELLKKEPTKKIKNELG